MKKVQIYSSPNCVYCKMAKAFLDDHKVAYEEFDVLANVEKRQEMIEKSGQMGVPVLVIGEDEVMVGFDENHLKILLGI